jgi:Polyketide cyclase / dehydrase and lipid transport
LRPSALWRQHLTRGLSYGRRLDLSAYHHRASITIDRSPEAIYDLLVDVSRMGTWSPVCTGGRYDDDSQEWFTGTNGIGETTWETRCRVVASDRGREFAFVNLGRDGTHAMVRWGFVLEPASGGGAEVTLTWDVLPGYPDGFAEEEDPGMTLEQRLDFMKAMAEAGMPETVASLKRDAEATPNRRSDLPGVAV